MVSRSNWSSRGPYEAGVLGQVYKGPSGLGKITPPSSGAETPARKPRRGKGIFNQVRSAIEQQRSQIEADRTAKYPTTSPGIGETAYRPGYTPPSEPQRRGGLSGMVQEAVQRQKEALESQDATPAVDPILGGAQPETGGNVSRGTPRRRGSAASRSRRNIR